MMETRYGSENSIEIGYNVGILYIAYVVTNQ